MSNRLFPRSPESFEIQGTKARIIKHNAAMKELRKMIIKKDEESNKVPTTLPEAVSELHKATDGLHNAVQEYKKSSPYKAPSGTSEAASQIPEDISMPHHAVELVIEGTRGGFVVVGIRDSWGKQWIQELPIKQPIPVVGLSIGAEFTEGKIILSEATEEVPEETLSRVKKWQETLKKERTQLEETLSLFPQSHDEDYVSHAEVEKDLDWALRETDGAFIQDAVNSLKRFGGIPISKGKLEAALVPGLISVHKGWKKAYRVMVIKRFITNIFSALRNIIKIR